MLIYRIFQIQFFISFIQQIQIVQYKQVDAQANRKKCEASHLTSRVIRTIGISIFFHRVVERVEKIGDIVNCQGDVYAIKHGWDEVVALIVWGADITRKFFRIGAKYDMSPKLSRNYIMQSPIFTIKRVIVYCREGASF